MLLVTFAYRYYNIPNRQYQVYLNTAWDMRFYALCIQDDQASDAVGIGAARSVGIAGRIGLEDLAEEPCLALQIDKADGDALFDQ